MAGDDSGSGRVVGFVLGGARAYLTGNTARELVRAIDVEALLDGGQVGEAIEREAAGRVLGRAFGRALADELADGSRITDFAVRVAGERVGAHLGQTVLIALVEYGLIASVIDELRTMTTDDGLLRLLDEVEAAATPDETAADSTDEYGNGNGNGNERGRDVDSYELND